MTENEAIERIKYRVHTAGQVTGESGMEELEMAIKALEEIQQYQVLEKRLAELFGDQLSLETVIDELERQLKEPGNPHPINAKILTYEDAAAWDAYRAIGTPEECQKSVTVSKAMIDRKITPENMEEYMKFEDECVKNVFTFDSLLKAREKQTAKKIVRRKATDENVESELRDFITRKGMIYRCPTCGCCIAVDEMKSCWECGQKLDWSDEE